MSKPAIKVNRIKLEEIDFVLKIQKNSYIDKYLEKSHTFNRMITLYPKGCLGVCVVRILAAYIFFHPYRENQVKPLDLSLVLDGNEDCMYLHDIAVHHNYRGKGLSKILLERFDQETIRGGFNVQCLVAVQSSEDFWEKHGFKKEFIIENYGGAQAYYMKKIL
jgi:ribosomal protein S18 acetylase RimI-like enzyme